MDNQLLRRLAVRAAVDDDTTSLFTELVDRIIELEKHKDNIKEDMINVCKELGLVDRAAEDE